MKILWVSRHQLNNEQLSDLERIYGDVEIVNFQDTVKSAEQLVEVGEDCEVFAVVLPLVAWEQVDELRIVTHRL